MNEDAREEAWWAENIGNIPSHDSNRSIAYLLAYFKLVSLCSSRQEYLFKEVDLSILIERS